MDNEKCLTQEEFDSLPFIDGNFNLSYYLLKLINYISSENVYNIVQECYSTYLDRINKKKSIYGSDKFNSNVYYMPRYKVYKLDNINRINIIVVTPLGDCGLVAITNMSNQTLKGLKINV